MMHCSLSLPGPNADYADYADSLRGSHPGVSATSTNEGTGLGILPVVTPSDACHPEQQLLVIPSGSEGSFVPFSWLVGHETAGWIPRRFAPRDVTLPSAYATVRSEEHVRVGPLNPR